MAKDLTKDFESGKIKGTAIKRTTGDIIADVIIYGVLAIVCLAMVYPFYNMLLVSVAKYKDIINTPVYIWPKAIDFYAYKLIFMDKTIPRAFGVSVLITIVGTILAMIVTTGAGYALSKKRLPGRNAIFMVILVTMYFSGGLIPFYLVVKDLGFLDSIWVLIIPTCLSTFNLILMKNYLLTIPESLEESARIDGANDIRIMFQIIIPCAAPIMATVGLFYAVAYWNEWWNCMLFIQDSKKFTLQLLLRRIVVESTLDLGDQMANAMRDATVKTYPLTIQMATVTVSTVPILCVYPFLQGYFTQGIMLGSIKE